MALSTRSGKKPTSADPADGSQNDQQLVIRAFSPKQESYFDAFKAEIKAEINSKIEAMDAKHNDIM